MGLGGEGWEGGEGVCVCGGGGGSKFKVTKSEVRHPTDKTNTFHREAMDTDARKDAAGEGLQPIPEREALRNYLNRSLYK